jgi:hypothetical protein
MFFEGSTNGEPIASNPDRRYGVFTGVLHNQDLGINRYSKSSFLRPHCIIARCKWQATCGHTCRSIEVMLQQTERNKRNEEANIDKGPQRLC